MLDDDQDMADMYLGRRQDASNTKEEEKARRAIEPPSPTASAVSMDSIEAADFMGQSESDTEVPARPNRPPSPGDANFIRKRTPIQAQSPPQVCPSHKGFPWWYKSDDHILKLHSSANCWDQCDTGCHCKMCQ